MNSPDNLSIGQSAAQGTELSVPCILVIFGITGDLTKRLLFPALCNLGAAGLLNENFHIVGIGRRPFTDESFQAEFTKSTDEFVVDSAAKKSALNLVKQISYLAGDFNDASTYQELKNKLVELSEKYSNYNYLFYFAVPPGAMQTITIELGKTDLLKETQNNFRRLIVEKPLGHDLSSAKALNALFASVAAEKQIYILDHFLGKEVVRNIVAFRFANSIFESLWDKSHIDHVQITVSEAIGVELRGNFYEESGALRDMIPNHLLQVLSLITMEQPTEFSADAIWAEKAKALNAIQILTPKEVETQVVRGQYGQGKINNKDVIAYRAEEDVAPDSNVETFVALKLFLNNDRWSNVPFYLRTGKRMPTRTSEIVVQFKSDSSPLFDAEKDKLMPNFLFIHIQPDAGISLRFNTKIPGPEFQLGQTDMNFKYSDDFPVKSQTGYETIILDCMDGDHMLFNHADMVETGWAIVQPILDAWSKQAPRDFPNYAAGTEGPAAAEQLLSQDGRKWLL